MHIYLIRHAETDTSHVTDPYNHPLSAAGWKRARELGSLCRQWQIELLVASMMQHSMQTADAISDELPYVERWDLEELEELTLDDLMLDPTASHLVSTWTPEQLQTGLSRLWVRVMPVVVRVQIYAEAFHLSSVAIVAGEQVLKLLLLNWLGMDWTNFDQLPFEVAPGAVCRVTVNGDDAELHWLDGI